MKELTKIDFCHRRNITDFTELVETLFPCNRNQQHAAACILFEIKWAQRIVPNLAFLEPKYKISRRILQRARAKLSRLGLVEHVSCFNTRYGGQHGWKLSTRFETALHNLATAYSEFKSTKLSSKEKDKILLEFTDAKRTLGRSKEPQDLNTS